MKHALPVILAVAATVAIAAPAQASSHQATRPALTKASATFVPSAVSVYGHSMTMDNYPYIPLQADGHHGEFGRKIATHYGATVDMNGKSGTKLMDNVRGITSTTYAGSTAYKWALGLDRTNTAVVLESLHNDEPSGDAWYQRGVKGALREAVAAFGAKSLVAPTYMSAGWAKSSYPDRAAGGSLYYTRTYGDKMDFTVSGTSATLAVIASDGRYLPYGTMKIYVNDVLWTPAADNGYWHATDKMKAYYDSVDDKSLRMWSQYGLHLTGMSAGTNKITVRKVDNTTNPIIISGVYQASSTPPQVYVAQENPRNPDATCGCAAAEEVNDPAFRALVVDICGEFTYCHVVDLRDGWVNPDMIASSDPYKVHPNMAGMNFLADKFERAIDATANPLGKASASRLGSSHA